MIFAQACNYTRTRAASKTPVTEQFGRPHSPMPQRQNNALPIHAGLTCLLADVKRHEVDLGDLGDPLLLVGDPRRYLVAALTAMVARVAARYS